MHKLKSILVFLSGTIGMCFPSQGVIFPSEELLEEAKHHTPTYGQYYIEAAPQKIPEQATSTSTRRANCIILEDEFTKKRVGLTSVHFLIPKEEQPQEGYSLSDSLEGAKWNYMMGILMPDFTVMKPQTMVPYNPTEDFCERKKKDIAIFTTPVLNIRTARLKLIREEPEEGQLYHGILGSYGPSFSRTLTSYEERVYHQTEIDLSYDKKGFFYTESKSRDFYIAFEPKDENQTDYEWFLAVLPSLTLSTVRGDSGAVVMTENREPLAILSGTDWDDFYEKNIELATVMNIFRENSPEPFTKKDMHQTVQKIEAEIAIPEHTRHFVKEDGSLEMYGFTLNTSYQPIRERTVYTPIYPYITHIESFLNEHALQAIAIE